VVGAAALIIGIGSAGGAPTNAVAAAVGLRASDLPGSGWHVQIPGGVVKTSNGEDAKVLRCMGLTTAANLGGGPSVDSPTFVIGTNAGTNTASSSVSVAPSRAAVVRNLALAANPRYPICSAKEQADTDHVTSGPNGAASMSDIRVTMLPFAAAGTDGGYGLLTTSTFHATVGGRTESLPAYDTVYVFGVGRIDIALSVNTFGGPPSTPLVQQVCRRLIARALAQPH
jgi:hypothetical protein